jgi:hypothetical protein
VVTDLISNLTPHWVELSPLLGASISISSNPQVVDFFFIESGPPEFSMMLNNFVSLVESVLILLDKRGGFRFFIDTSTLQAEHPEVVSVISAMADKDLRDRGVLNGACLDHDARALLLAHTDYLTWVAKAASRMELYNPDSM